MKKLLASLLIPASLLIAQPQPSTAQIEAMEEFIYSSTQEIFQKKEYQYSPQAFKKPWDKKPAHSKKVYTNALKTLDKNAKVELGKGFFNKKRITFTSELPKNFTIDQGDLVLEISQSSMKDSKGAEVPFKKSGMVSLGNRSSSGFSKGKSYNNNWIRVTSTFESDVPASTKAKGSVTINAKCITGHNILKINALSKGKELKLGSHIIKVVDVFNNKIIIDAPGLDMSAFDFVNLDAKGKELKKIDFQSYSKKVGPEKAQGFGDVAGKGLETLDREMYKAFSENADMSFKTFKKLFHEPLMNRSKNHSKANPNYLVLETAAPIETVWLYSPKFGVKKRIIKKIK
ncbi:MAG: hypothetical protein OCD01_09770 [Fibrobacterales bacterium]